MGERLPAWCCILGALVLALPLDAESHQGARHARPSTATRLVWSDDFDGPAGSAPDPRKWRFELGGGGWGNGELEYYTARPQNASLDGLGRLAVTARRESYAGGGVTRSYTSARLQTKGLMSTIYGRLEASIKLPPGRGLWPAFWAVGSDVESAGWPQSGEIDIMESLGNDPFTLYGSIHGPQRGSASGYHLTTPHRAAASLASAFHTYGVDWGPGAIVFTLDGVPYATRTPASLSTGERWVFNKPFFLLLNLAVGGTWPGAPDASTLFPATMLVDWVRVYAP
jgi:beta-glucanase (GH16 family)